MKNSFLRKYSSVLVAVILASYAVGSYATNNPNICIASVDSLRQGEAPKYEDSDDDRHGKLDAFYLEPYTGDLKASFVDTLKYDWYRRAIYNAVYASTASAGGTYASPLFSRLLQDQDFNKAPLLPWGNPYSHLLLQDKKQRFFDVKVPYTSVSYVKQGGTREEENNFHFTFASNIGKRFNFGGEFNYDYAKGIYASTKSKNVTYRIFSSYKGEKYKAYASVGNTNIVNFESGGILDDDYILNPDKFREGKRSFQPKDIPTRLQRTWNRNIFGDARFHHRYSLGFRKEHRISKDSVTQLFVPVTSFYNDVRLRRHRRRFVSEMPSIGEAYTDVFIQPLEQSKHYPDETHLYEEISTTVGVSLEEGFHKWAKMGLSAYFRWETQRFTLPTLTPEQVFSKETMHTSYIGGRLGAKKIFWLQYDVRFDLGLIGAYAGNLQLDADALLKVKLWNRENQLKLYGQLKNEAASYLHKHYNSSFFKWDNTFKATQSIRLGADLELALTGSKLKFLASSVQNPIYIGAEAKPEQLNDNYRLYTLSLEQDTKISIFHWDNKIYWQKVSHKNIFPAPELIAQSTLYMRFPIAKVMSFSAGLDAYWYSAYKAPYYEPALQILQPKDALKMGGEAPDIHAFAYAHLKRTRFFIMYYNLGALLLGPNNLSLPHYPSYPPMLRMGLIVDFRN